MGFGLRLCCWRKRYIEKVLKCYYDYHELGPSTISSMTAYAALSTFVVCEGANVVEGNLS